MKRLDMNKITRSLGAERRGKVASAGGYFGAAQLAAEIEARFRVPLGGGRPTDASSTERGSRPEGTQQPMTQFGKRKHSD
jgi:hypothetical protein